MSKVWRKLNRVGKKASKYKFTTHSHILTINGTPKWHPDRVCITWTRRNRKIQSKFSQWEPSLYNIYEGLVYWEKSTDYLEFDVSLYRGINDDKFEEKDWSILVESEDSSGKRRLLAVGKLNMNDYASIDPLFQTDIGKLNLKVMSKKISSASISFSLMCQFLKEGKATDDDMISIASYMSTVSTNNPYLNSNAISFANKKMKQLGSNFEWDLENDMREGSSNDDGEGMNFDVLTARNDNDQDDIEFYMRLKTTHLNKDDDFNKISKNFGNQVQRVTEDFLKTFDKDEIPAHSANSTKIDKTLSPKEKALTAKKQPKAPAPVKIAIDDQTNNEKNSESSNPFEDTINVTQIVAQDSSSNPFLSPSLTNSLDNDDVSSNPFFNDQTPSVKIEKRKSPVRIITNKAALKPIAPIANSIPAKQIPDELFSDTGKELLTWCQNIIKIYQQSAYMPANKTFSQLDINNFTTSWTNGLAFCAIFYHFKPNLITLDCLNDNYPKVNLTQAFKASDSEKIGRVVDTSDFLNKDKLDQLLIMTYLFQLRDHFEPPQLNQKDNTSAPLQSPTLNNKTTSSSSFLSPLKPQKQKATNTSTPIKNHLESPAQKVQSSYSNPFDSDPDENEEENKEGEVGTNKRSINKKITKMKIMTNDSVSSVELSTQYSAKTEDLIQKARDNLEKSINSQSKMDDIGEKVKLIINKRRKSSMPNSVSIDQSLMVTSSSIVGTEYVNQEIINFRNEQKELDEHAVFLENKLRSVMANSTKNVRKSDRDKELEDRLLKEWFLLINRKSALLIRQQEIEIIQNEKNLEKRYELLSDKLRDLVLIDEFCKTEEQKTGESILLNELISNVMERNNLVLQMDEENKLLNEGEIINEYIQNKSTFQHVEKSCSIQ